LRDDIVNILKVYAKDSWFQRFRNGNFDINDKLRGQSRKMKENLEILFAEDATQSSVKLAKQLAINHTTVLQRLHALGKIQKEEK